MQFNLYDNLEERPDYPSRRGDDPITDKKYDNLEGGKRDHIIPVKEIHDAVVRFFNQFHNPNDNTAQQRELEGFINALEASRNHFVREMVLGNNQPAEANGIVNRLFDMGEVDAEEILSRLFAWLPGNLVVGLRNTDTHPEPNPANTFDHGAFNRAINRAIVVSNLYHDFPDRWERLCNENNQANIDNNRTFIHFLAGQRSPTW